jgi:predicted RNase H-like HicB family nuclease
MKKTYVARLSRDEDGYWSGVVAIDAEQSAISDGQTMGKVRKRMRQAVALLLDVTEDAFELDFQLDLPKPVLNLVARLAVAQADAGKAEQALVEARAKAVNKLTSLGISVRDVGEILGVSGAYVHQVKTTAH